MKVLLLVFIVFLSVLIPLNNAYAEDIIPILMLKRSQGEVRETAKEQVTEEGMEFKQVKQEADPSRQREKFRFFLLISLGVVIVIPLYIKIIFTILNIKG